MEVIPLLKQLSEAQGPTGHEDPVRELIRQIWQPFVDEMQEGKLGSLIAVKRGTAPEPRSKLMLAAHMDEIGLRVSGIEKGFLRVTRIGGTDRRALLGLEVIIHAERDLPGIVAARPPHVLGPEERKKILPWDRFFVDVGLPTNDVEQLVHVGDLISVRREMVELKNRRVAGKAFDDRACVAIIALALEQLVRSRHAWDVFAVATVQEENGLKGATASAYGVAPDAAVALDVGFAKHPGVTDIDASVLGEGAMIGIGPNFHPKLVTRLREVADAREIPYRMDPIPGRSGTDAWAIQIAREGIPTTLLEVPIRYLHQPVETLDVRDVERAGRLLAAFVDSLEPDFVNELAWDMGESE